MFLIHQQERKTTPLDQISLKLLAFVAVLQQEQDFRIAIQLVSQKLYAFVVQSVSYTLKYFFLSFHCSSGYPQRTANIPSVLAIENLETAEICIRNA
jgi:hypothetical protein